MEIRNSRILLTGATGGLGRALAMELAHRGGRLILADQDRDKLEPLAETTSGEFIVADLSSREDNTRLLTEVGDVDIFVANAAMHSLRLFTEVGQDDIDTMIDTNLRSPITMAKTISDRMIERGHGQIVLILSLAAKTFSRRASLYCATKAGLRAFGIALREDLRPHNVGVTLIVPGYIDFPDVPAQNRVDLLWEHRTSPVSEVVLAIVDAITRNRGEVTVSPQPTRLLYALGSVFPNVIAAYQRVRDTDRITRQLAAGRSFP